MGSELCLILFYFATASCLSILEVKRIFDLYIVQVRNSYLTGFTYHVFILYVEYQSSFFFFFVVQLQSVTCWIVGVEWIRRVLRTTY